MDLLSTIAELRAYLVVAELHDIPNQSADSAEQWEANGYPLRRVPLFITTEREAAVAFIDAEKKAKRQARRYFTHYPGTAERATYAVVEFDGDGKVRVDGNRLVKMLL